MGNKESWYKKKLSGMTKQERQLVNSYCRIYDIDMYAKDVHRFKFYSDKDGELEVVGYE